MASMRVDHSKFEDLAAEIDTYVCSHKANMKEADGEITALRSSWDGADYAEAKRKWNTMNDADSYSEQMITKMEAYAAFLRYSAEQYRNAQAKAFDSAIWLP